MRSLRAHAWQTVIASYYTIVFIATAIFHTGLDYSQQNCVFLCKLIEAELMIYGHTNMSLKKLRDNRGLNYAFYKSTRIRREDHLSLLVYI